MSTLYEILEVSENASKEVIDKAYRVLAKKYHPDLQTEENKKNAEIKMRQINQAYEVLSDDVKRKEYDQSLLSKREEKNNYTNTQNGQASYSENYYKQNQNTMSAQEIEQERRYRDMQRRKYEAELQRKSQQMEKQMQEQYQNAYYNYLRSLGYKIKEKWTWKKTKKLFLAIIIFIATIGILWVIPPTHDIMLNLYEENKAVQILADIAIGLVSAVVDTFKSLFNH